MAVGGSIRVYKLSCSAGNLFVVLKTKFAEAMLPFKVGLITMINMFLLLG